MIYENARCSRCWKYTAPTFTNKTRVVEAEISLAHYIQLLCHPSVFPNIYLTSTLKVLAVCFNAKGTMYRSKKMGIIFLSGLSGLSMTETFIITGTPINR